jgi:hypothetical protein
MWKLDTCHWVGSVVANREGRAYLNYVNKVVFFSIPKCVMQCGRIFDITNSLDLSSVWTKPFIVFHHRFACCSAHRSSLQSARISDQESSRSRIIVHRTITRMNWPLSKSWSSSPHGHNSLRLRRWSRTPRARTQGRFRLLASRGVNKFSRHSPNWRVVQYFHSPSPKTTGQKYRMGQWDGKKPSPNWRMGFVFLLANPEFYLHLASGYPHPCVQ